MTDVRSTNVNLLIAFDILASERSVTAAARCFGVTQSSMSGILAQLRELFNDPILVRVGNAMQLTPRAQELARQVRLGVEAFNAALKAPAQFTPATSTASFQVAMNDSAEVLLLPQLLARFEQVAPEVSIQVLPWGMHEPPPGLAQGEVQLMVGMCDKVNLTPSHHAQDLLEDRFVCVVRAGHPQVRSRLTLKTYLSLDHVVVTERAHALGVVDRILARRGLKRRIGLRVPHFFMVPEIVAKTNFIAALDERIARYFAKRLGIRIFEPPLELPGGTTGLVWHESTNHDPGCTWLRSELAATARKLASRDG